MEWFVKVTYLSVVVVARVCFDLPENKEIISLKLEYPVMNSVGIFNIFIWKKKLILFSLLSDFFPPQKLPFSAQNNHEFTSISWNWHSNNPEFDFIVLPGPLDRNYKQIDFHRKVMLVMERFYINELKSLAFSKLSNSKYI